MSIYKILSHPYTLIMSYFMMLIIGEHIGGIYLMYVLMALYYGGIHSLLAIAGTLIIFISHHRLKNKKYDLLGRVLNIVALFMLFFSVYYFFWNDPKNYNRGTFEQTIPLLTFILTGFLALCFLLDNLPLKKFMIPRAN
ncbi:MAG: hypothetical protein ACR2KB_12710 [Chitinophagaceae bacterium]